LINPGQVELPSIGKTSNPPVAPLEVSIRTDQSLWLRDRAAGTDDRKVTRNELIAAIKQKQTQNPEQAVVIAADKDVRYESVLDVMDMLQQNQVKKVGLMVKPRSQ
jgi:biopolymer transport protein TolR